MATDDPTKRGPDDGQTPGDEDSGAFDAEEFDRELKKIQEGPLFTAPPVPEEIPEVLREPPPGAPRAATPPPGSSKAEDDTRNRLVRLSAIGTDFGLTVIIAGGLGYGVDYLAKTKPWGLLIGIVVGVFLGGFRFIREGMAANRRALEDLKKNRRP